MWSRVSLWHNLVWQQLSAAIRYRMVHRCRIVQTGIISFCGEDWLRLSRNMCIKAINFILKAVCAIVVMTTSRASAVM